MGSNDDENCDIFDEEKKQITSKLTQNTAGNLPFLLCKMIMMLEQMSSVITRLTKKIMKRNTDTYFVFFGLMQNSELNFFFFWVASKLAFSG